MNRFAELLDRRVSRSATSEDGGRALGLIFFGHPEIHQGSAPAMRRDNDIGGFDVSMQDRWLLLMQVHEGIHDGL